VLLTIITRSKIAHLRSVYISMLPPFGLFPLKGNGTYIEPFHETFMSCIDFRVSYIHLKDVAIIQNIFLCVDHNKVMNRLTAAISVTSHHDLGQNYAGAKLK